MNRDSRHDFDRKGLAFIAKTFIFIALLIVSTKFIANSAAVFLLSVPDNTVLAETIDSTNLASAIRSAAPPSIFMNARDLDDEEKGTVDTKLISKIKQAQGLEVAIATPPNTSAGSYVVADITSGQIYAEKNSDEIRPIASISKLMTALIANDFLSSDREIIVTEKAANSYGNLANFSVGEKMSVADMLHPMMLSSANDAAISIGDYFGEARFKELMNQQARIIGMTRTHFVEPSGLSAQNISTAHDLFKLARHIHEHKNAILDLTRIESKTVQTNLDSYNFQNIHQLRHIEGYIGGKNGYISASGRTLLSLFEIKDSEGEVRTIAIVVLGSENSTTDSLNLLSWLKKTL